jgi:hypothetical protein
MRSIANKQILIMELFNTTQHLLLLEVIVSRTLYSYQTSGQYMLFQQGDRLNGGQENRTHRIQEMGTDGSSARCVR